MALNLNNEQDQQDNNLSKKLLSLQEDNYNTERGWDKLAGNLSNQRVPILNPSPTKTTGKITSLSIWKAVAAAVILLAAGFLTGRISSHKNIAKGNNLPVMNTPGTTLRSLQQTTTMKRRFLDLILQQ